MATQQGVGVEDLRLQGSGLAFVAYPSAIAQMPGAQFFACLFFVMVVCLGVDSQFAMVETVLTALNDAKIMPHRSKALKSAMVCLLMGLIGLLFVTRAGLHWLDIFDTFAVTITLFICGALECVAVCGVYGADRFAEETLRMTKVRLPRLVLFDLTYIVPSLLTVLTIWTLYSTTSAGYDFPAGGIAVGYTLSYVSLLPIAYCLVKEYRSLGRGALAVVRRMAACVRALVGRRSAGRKPRLPTEVSVVGTPFGSPAGHSVTLEGGVNNNGICGSSPAPRPPQPSTAPGSRPSTPQRTPAVAPLPESSYRPPDETVIVVEDTAKV